MKQPPDKAPRILRTCGIRIYDDINSTAMVELIPHLTGPVFGIDTKMHYKEWFNNLGVRKEFRGLLGVSVNPVDNGSFEAEFDRIMSEVCARFKIDRNRRVYKAHDIGVLLSPNENAYKSFCLNVARELLSLEDVKFNYFVTRINTKHLENGKVTIYGNYGTATKMVSPHEFIDKISPYYTVICAWKLGQITGVRSGMFIFDGTEDILPCHAWNEFSSSQYLRIVFGGDKTIPVVASADFLLRSLDFFLQERRGILDEKAIQSIVLHNDIVPAKDKFFRYIGNPDLDKIKPLSESPIRMRDMEAFVHHPIIFLSAGGIVGQSSIIETSPIQDKLLNNASELCAGVRVYDPRKDRFLIGASPTKDYFFPFNKEARDQLEALRTGGRNVEEFVPF
jgi:hypothetical protein